MGVGEMGVIRFFVRMCRLWSANLSICWGSYDVVGFVILRLYHFYLLIEFYSLKSHFSSI